jgi:hypothetical protein
MILSDLSISGALRNLPVMEGLNEIIDAGGTLTRAFLFDHLIGFTLIAKELKDEYRSAWHFVAGPLYQPPVWVECYRVGQDWESLYKRYGFTLCERSSHGCEMLAEMIEREQTPPSEVTPADVSQQTSTQRALELARIWLERPRKTGGPTEGQQRFVAAILGNGGAMSHVDLRFVGEFTWEDPRKGATNMATRINKTLSESGQLWSIIREDNSRCMIVLNSDLESRS